MELINKSYGQKLTLLVVVVTITTASIISCVPNIRIQVNNDNLQSPPYLLQAIKEAELKPTTSNQNVNAPLALPQVTNSKENSPVSLATTTNISSAKNAESEDSIGNDDELSGTPHSFSVVKEETIEEILDLDPESVLKLAPEHLISEASSSNVADYSSKPSDLVAVETSSQNQMMRPKDEENQEIASSGAESNPGSGFQQVIKPHEKKPQTLPVTNSHLKKPAGSLLNDGEPMSSANQSAAASDQGLNQGAKSMISPSVANDQDAQLPAEIQPKIRKVNVQIPDTLEPSQVMNGVTNASLVPATITREYGAHTRTRVTLGGGYVRDKSPPLVSPVSSEYEDKKPAKPVTPLEKPHLNPPQGSNEDSRIIEVPERIVLPMSIFKQQPNEDRQKQVSVNKQVSALVSNQTLPVRKRDNRCPREGVTTFEHPKACDKYFYCEDGIISEHTCPNGLLYGTREMVTDYCVHRWKVVCGEKSIPNPISSPGCRWQYGIFNVQGSPRCSPDFYECFDGTFSVKKCSIEGQVYDDRTKSCQFAELIGCKTEALSDFKCPPDDQANTYWPFPRYFLNERSLIHCVNDKPEIVRCRDDERVDPEHLHCVPLEKLSPQANGESNADGSSLTARRVREKKKPTTTSNNNDPKSAAVASYNSNSSREEDTY